MKRKMFYPFFLELQGEKGKITIQELYKIDTQSETVLDMKYGEWIPKKGITVFESNVFKRRSNFHGFVVNHQTLNTF